MKYNKVAAITFAIMVLAIIWVAYRHDKVGPWYLGCSDGKQEYLMKVDERPIIDGSFIRIGSDTFVTPMQGMTCKVIPVSEVEKGVDNESKVK